MKHSPETVHLVLPDGSFIVVVRWRDHQLPSEWELYREPVGYVRIDSVYSPHWLGRWDGPEFVNGDFGFILENRRSMVAGGGDPISIYITNGDHYEIRQFSATGVLLRIIRRTGVEPVPVTDEELREWVRTIREENPGMDWRGYERASAQWPRRFRRPLSAMRVDPLGYLWVRDGTREEADGLRSEWSVFDPDGRWLGTLTMPTDGVYWIGEDLILGQFRDSDLGVGAVLGYRLDRRGQS